MKLKFYFSAIVAALLLGSCAQNLETPEIDKMKTISASISNETETRSTVEIDGDVANFLWADGDAIVLLGEGNKIEATLVSGQESAKGEFSYTGDYEPKAGDVAIYPYSSSHTTTSVNLPAEYNLGDNTNNTNALMYGVYTTNPDHLAFKQMAGVLRFDLKKLPAQTSKMVITADKGISGDFTIESGAVNAVVSDGTNNVVTINFDELTAEVESQLFYLPIPVGTYENIEVALYDQNDLKTVATTVSTSTKEIARAQMIGFSFQPADLPVKVGDRGYESIEVALGATTGDVTLSLGEGTYYIPEAGLSGRNVVFEGASKEGTIVDMSVISGTPQYGAASVTFKNLTMKRKAEAYGGLTHSSAEKYDNCIIEGTLVTYAPLVEVKNSSFVPAANEYYNVHIYSTGTSTFENCTFETDACRAVYAHAESAVEMNISFDGCTFKSNTDAGKDFRWHQAIRLHTELGIYGTLSINNCSVNENGNFNPAYNGGLWVEWNNSTKELTNKFVTTVDGSVVGQSVVVSTVDEMKSALSNVSVANIKMMDRLLPSAAFSHYNKTIDGQDNYIWGGTFNSINTQGGTIKNLGFWQAEKAINIVGQKSKVILNNVKVVSNYNCNYAIHADEGNGYGLEATDCEFYSHIAYVAALGNVKFTNCTFGPNKNGSTNLTAYAPTEFVDCEFKSGYPISAIAACTFKNCTLDGVDVTVDNIATLVTSGTENNATVINN